jgi:hypothetical protein
LVICWFFWLFLCSFGYFLVHLILMVISWLVIYIGSICIVTNKSKVGPTY